MGCKTDDIKCDTESELSLKFNIVCCDESTCSNSAPTTTLNGIHI